MTTNEEQKAAADSAAEQAESDGKGAEKGAKRPARRGPCRGSAGKRPASPHGGRLRQLSQARRDARSMTRRSAAAKTFLRELLPVFDNLERAAAHARAGYRCQGSGRRRRHGAEAVRRHPRAGRNQANRRGRLPLQSLAGTRPSNRSRPTSIPQGTVVAEVHPVTRWAIAWCAPPWSSSPDRTEERRAGTSGRAQLTHASRVRDAIWFE